jgi:hypothetical protein
MNEATWWRARVVAQAATRAELWAALQDVAPASRDAWVDQLLDLGPPPDDGPALPRGCVPYLPAGVEALLAVAASVRPDDVFVDVGAGVGRAVALVHLLTGAVARGLEIQPDLAHAARAMLDGLGVPAAAARVELGDAVAGVRASGGTVFFLYCPFGGARLDQLLVELEAIARARPITVACLDLPVPSRAWLELVAEPVAGLQIFRGDALSPAPPRG